MTREKELALCNRDIHGVWLVNEQLTNELEFSITRRSATIDLAVLPAGSGLTLAVKTIAHNLRATNRIAGVIYTGLGAYPSEPILTQVLLSISQTYGSTSVRTFGELLPETDSGRILLVVDNLHTCQKQAVLSFLDTLKRDMKLGRSYSVLLFYRSSELAKELLRPGKVRPVFSTESILDCKWTRAMCETYLLRQFDSDAHVDENRLEQALYTDRGNRTGSNPNGPYRPRSALPVPVPCPYWPSDHSLRARS